MSRFFCVSTQQEECLGSFCEWTLLHHRTHSNVILDSVPDRPHEAEEGGCEDTQKLQCCHFFVVLVIFHLHLWYLSIWPEVLPEWPCSSKGGGSGSGVCGGGGCGGSVYHLPVDVVYAGGGTGIQRPCMSLCLVFRLWKQSTLDGVINRNLSLPVLGAGSSGSRQQWLRIW